MSRSTISTFKLFEMYPDETSARKYLESRLWKDGIQCPKCQSKASEHIRERGDGFYRCNGCGNDNFTVRTGTIFGRSHVPLHKWVYAMYLLVTARKGISSLQLGKEIGITQKSAWFVLQRLREACGGDSAMLKGVVEIDEVYLGGKEQNKHMSKRLHGDRGLPEKTAVVGMRERGGRTKATTVSSTGTRAMTQLAFENIEKGSTIHTDEWPGYTKLGESYTHERVHHGSGEYTRGEVTTNGIESVFAVMRRGLHGVYHHASKKHMRRYVDEFTWRLNEGNVKRHSLERLDSFVDAVAGKRITYKELTSDNGKDANPQAF